MQNLRNKKVMSIQLASLETLDRLSKPFYIQKKIGHIPFDQAQTEALEGVALDKLVQVDGEQLGRNAKVVTKVKVVCHADQIMLVLGILKAESTLCYHEFDTSNTLSWIKA